MLKLEHLRISLNTHIAEFVIDRPEKANAMAFSFWQQLDQALQWAENTSEVRVIVLKASGEHFSSGIDLLDFQSILVSKESCDARKREHLHKTILQFQSAFSRLESCQKPVIAQIQGACLGGALDLIAACDMRFCTDDAYYQIKEIDLGMVADLGTLQRLPYLLPIGLVMELAMTGRKITAKEATECGLINQKFESYEALSLHVHRVATTISEKSPLAIRGIKKTLLYSRDHTVKDSLDQVASWNSAFLLSSDLEEAIAASIQKRKAVFKD